MTDTARLVGEGNCSMNTQSTNPKQTDVCQSVWHRTIKNYAYIIHIVHYCYCYQHWCYNACH